MNNNKAVPVFYAWWKIYKLNPASHYFLRIPLKKSLENFFPVGGKKKIFNSKYTNENEIFENVTISLSIFKNKYSQKATKIACTKIRLCKHIADIRKFYLKSGPKVIFYLKIQ